MLTEETKSMPDKPHGPKIASITDRGIEFYWKKVEHASGYEVFRSYEEEGIFEKIGENNKRSKGEYIDSDFDHSRKEIYYKSRSYINNADGTREYSAFTKPAAAVFRDQIMIEREVSVMYDGASRKIRAFYGWGEVSDAKWTSDDENVATIDREGFIHAIAAGEAVIRCSSKLLGQEKTAKVIVNRKSMKPLVTGKRRYVFNSENGHWENRTAKKRGDAVIMMAGDMMCGTNQTKRQYTKENGWSYNDSYEYVRNTTALSDFAIGNLETLMAPGWPYMIDEAYIDNKNNCNNPSRYLDAVLYGGFDAVAMSNNHNCDGGTRALEETIDAVLLRDIPYTGVFKSKEERRYVIINVNGIKVGFLAYMSENTSFNKKDEDWTQEEKDTMLNVFSKERAAADVKNCRAAGAEFIVAYMHWGHKNYRNITNVQKRESQEIADAGADYIVGANPHVVQIYDEIRSEDGRMVPCFYSIGNFQANMNQVPGNRDSVLVRIRLKRKWNGRIVLKENNYIPYHTYKERNGCYLAPVALSQQFDKEIAKPRQEEFHDRVVAAVGNKIEPL